MRIVIIAQLKCHATGVRLDKAIHVRRHDKTPTEVVNTPCCNTIHTGASAGIKCRWTDMSQCWWSMVQHPFQSQESRQVLQLLRQAFFSHKVIYASNQRGPVNDCSARQVMFIVTNDRACRQRTLNV